MDQAEDDFVGNIFIYRGRRAPQHITRARIDKSANEIEDWAFYGCKHLLTVETHDGIRRVVNDAFRWCESLRRINLKSVLEIGNGAFGRCKNLESAEFGEGLETIGIGTFNGCTSLVHLKLPSIITIKKYAFDGCRALIDIELSERLQTIDEQAFHGCERLQHIAIPLKRDLFEFSDMYEGYNQFGKCNQLTIVDLVGGIHETVASLHMESWRTDMNESIKRINKVLPTTPADEKTNEIRQWMDSVLDKMDHYKENHFRYVKEGTTLLELALWKAKLGEKEDNFAEGGKTKKPKVDAESARKRKRITCGADMVIKNVLPFLQLE